MVVICGSRKVTQPPRQLSKRKGFLLGLLGLTAGGLQSFGSSSHHTSQPVSLPNSEWLWRGSHPWCSFPASVASLESGLGLQAGLRGWSCCINPQIKTLIKMNPAVSLAQVLPCWVSERCCTHVENLSLLATCHPSSSRFNSAGPQSCFL